MQVSRNTLISGLPAGLEVSGFYITGTPTNVGPANTANITATDSNGNTAVKVMYFPEVEDSGGGAGPTWSIPTITSTYTYLLTLTKDTAMTDINLSASGSGAVSYSDDAMFPSGISRTGSTISGTPDTESASSTTTRITATDSYNSSTSYIDITFPAVEAAASVPTWSTPTITAIYTYPSTLTVDTAMTDINLSASGTGIISYSDDAMFPSGISRSGSTISGTPDTEYAYSTTTRITATDNFDSSTSYIDITFPMVNAPTGTVAFQTPFALTSKIQSESISETVVATAIPSSAITYKFISSTDSQEGLGIAGTAITVTGNTISGIAPRLYVAATYSFTFKATTAGGAINTQTFTIFISQDATCVSPSNNICT